MNPVKNKNKRNISVTVDDFRQMGVIAQNELRKFIRGRKILLYVLLIGLIVSLNIGFLVYYPDVLESLTGTIDKQDMMLSMYGGSLPFLILIGAVLFASYTIVSEFEERTYLLLFTRPIKKTSIFVGKFLACYFIVMVMTLAYYGIYAGHSFIVTGAVSSKIGLSLLVALFDVFALTSLAMLFSTITKKGSVSALMTFFVVIMVPTILLTLLMFKDPTYSMNTGYQLEHYWYLINVAESVIYDVATADISLSKPILSLFLWGIVPLVTSWVVFIKKEV